MGGQLENGSVGVFPCQIVKPVASVHRKEAIKLSKKQKAKLQTVFNTIDGDGSGVVTKDELVVGFKALGMNLSAQDIKSLMHMVDEDNSGEINFDEFCEIFMHRMR